MEIDPLDAWRPWRPSAADPWGRKWAAHLYRRAAFGSSRQELIEAERLGPEATLNLLLHGRPEADELLATLTDIGSVVAGRDDDGTLLRGWWLYCMLQGGHPLREKMALFWHNHFATSIAKVQQPGLMFRQNWLLRVHGLGKFATLLTAISKDPAMLIWLDSNRNVSGRPNENFARELMELFTLGVGHYTETDIREAARAFTGWRTDGEKFSFDSRLHDAGRKTVLGQAGNWQGDDILRIVLEQPVAASFLVRKLYRNFISEEAEPPDSLLAPLCDAFRKSEYDIAALVRTMLSSRHFFSEHAFRARIKNPVEFVLGAVQAIYRRFGEGEPDYRPLPQQALVKWLAAIGQSLFAPPNVKGWPGGRSWLNTSTVLARDNFATALALGTLWSDQQSGPATATASVGNTDTKPAGRGAQPAMPLEPAPPLAFDPARLLSEEGVSSPEEIIRALLDLYVPGGVRSEERAALVVFVADGKPAGPALDRRMREAVHVILTIPEYQLG